MSRTSLQQYLSNAMPRQRTAAGELPTIVAGIAACAAVQASLIARRELDATTGPGALADQPSCLSQQCHDLYVESLARLPLAFIASEKQPGLIAVDAGAPLAVTVNPLDGFSNIETNGPVGALFSVLAADARGLFEKPLAELPVAVGFVLFGPQTRLVLSLGDGCQLFLLDPDERVFYLIGQTLEIPPGRREFAINTAHYRYWDDSLRAFIDDCVAGENGPLGEDFNMRWSGSLVAEAYRILRRGGIFLYPSDARAGHQHGRLRLLFDALPLAVLTEQAGGLACDGSESILALGLESLEQKTPLILGSGDRVREVIDYLSGDALENSRFPLFDHRSLFRHQGR